METETAQMEYFLTNYGRCKLEKCRCIDWKDPRFEGAWGGLACPDWETLGAKSFFELIKKVSDERKD